MRRIAVALLSAATLFVPALAAANESPMQFLMRENAKRRAAADATIVSSVTIEPQKVSKPKVAKPRIPARLGGDLDRFLQPVPEKLEARQVAFYSLFEPGTIIVDGSRRTLYYVESSTVATRYLVGVGREGFGWTGGEMVTRLAKWPDWRPPPEMRKRDPSLPEMMPGGPRNPLGARALYLGSSLFRIHGSLNPRDAGKAVSSGCIRMLNAHAVELYGRVIVGKTRVVVVTALPDAIFGPPSLDSVHRQWQWRAGKETTAAL
jgi:lipoprotein-anchoring transpeptidase ErfK/SrfK